ncbi:MAG: divergent polysaccharide deacetylase family protein [Alteromonadaceae bacterium]|nr:divergent polysaccharide deacetylase family protein [Alteromonadaceae bacterium]
MPRFLVFILLLAATHVFAEQAQVAIIIDDIGYRQSDANALKLPGNITYSILPHTPFGKTLAQQAHDQKREVMLHIPMEAENGKELGPGGLTADMNESDIQASLNRAFAEIPFAAGMNNHMGSLLTQLYSPMTWTMRFLKKRKVYFIDSVTTGQSKAEKIAHQFGVPSMRRNVFLDNQLSTEYIQQQFLYLINQANIHHSVIAIAHPHPETIAALTKLIPILAENNIALVPISQLLTQEKAVKSVNMATD